MDIVKKIVFRISRILSFKNGIWAKKLGKNNRFSKRVIIAENCDIGNYNYFGPNSIINNAKIGNYCSVAPNVQIGPGVHSKNFITTYQPISSKLINHSLNSKKVIIGNDVWFGANVVVMQGISIGDGAIIGSNAVVTKNVPDYAIVVGVPARVHSYRFDKELIRKIKSSEWFNCELQEAMMRIKNIGTN